MDLALAWMLDDFGISTMASAPRLAPFHDRYSREQHHESAHRRKEDHIKDLHGLPPFRLQPEREN
jgi:hypothetical protein